MVSFKKYMIKKLILVLLYQYMTEDTCDKAVDSYLLALKLAPDWHVKNKIIEKLDDAVFSNDGVTFEPNIVIFFSNDIGLNSIVFNNVYLHDDNFDNCDSKTINQDLWLGITNISNIKTYVKKKVKNI